MDFDRNAFLSTLSRPIVAVEAPGFEALRMRALTGAEVSEINAAMGDTGKEPGAFTRAITARTLCDPDGGRVFSVADAGALFDAPAGVTFSLSRQALAVNKMDGGDSAPRK